MSPAGKLAAKAQSVVQPKTARAGRKSGARKARSKPRPPLVELLVTAGLLAALGSICFHLKFWLLDLDVWWHIRTGAWIVQHHAVPHTGLFSRTAAERPWIAYSWLYEVLVSRAYAWFGVVGTGWFETLLTLAAAYTLFWMARRLSGRFWLACLLAAAGCCVFLVPAYALRCCSMVLFTITLTLLLEANRSDRVQRLYWLPLIFLLWANLHIQFVYGLAVVGLFVGVNLLQRLASRFGIAPAWLVSPALPALPLLAITGACLVSTCIGPYSFHLYQVIYAYAKAKVPYSIIVELQPLDFRHYNHYVELVLVAVAFVAIGWKKQLDAFKLLLLVVASAVAFRTVRDAWFVTIPAIACLADVSPKPLRGGAEAVWDKLVLAALTIMSLLLLAPALGFNATGLEAAIRSEFPLDAVNYLRQNPRPGPLYNTFNWGGFLILYLPQYPVAIDNRTDVYGDQLDELFTLTARGVSYRDDPYLHESRLILLQKNKILVKFLSADPQYRLIYEDPLASIFVRR